MPWMGTSLPLLTLAHVGVTWFQFAVLLLRCRPQSRLMLRCKAIQGVACAMRRSNVNIRRDAARPVASLVVARWKLPPAAPARGGISTHSQHPYLLASAKPWEMKPVCVLPANHTRRIRSASVCAAQRRVVLGKRGGSSRPKTPKTVHVSVDILLEGEPTSVSRYVPVLRQHRSVQS
jgi:hypothetical protein